MSTSLRVSIRRADGSRSIVGIAAPPHATVADVARHLYGADPLARGKALPSDATLVVTALSTGPDGPARFIDPHLDLAASGIRSGDHVEVVSASDAASIDVGPVVGVVTVVEGIDLGRSCALRPGSHVIGRAEGSDLRLSDPLSSLTHARITVGDAVEIVDMGSTNGVLLGDCYVTRATLSPGDRVSIGDTVLEFVRVKQQAHVVPTTSTIPYTRSPRVVPPIPAAEVDLPEPPSTPPARSFPRSALVAPVVMGVGMLMLTGRLLSLAFVAMAPIMMVGAYLDNRRSQRRAARTKGAEFALAIEATEHRLCEVHDATRRARLLRSPSVREVREAIENARPPLWAHRAEHDQFLEVRLGLGSESSPFSLQPRQHGDALPEASAALNALCQRHARLSDMPITASLRVSGSLGIAGPRELADAVARGVVLQLVGLHSPMECVVTAVLAPSASAWAWLEWLPHAHSPKSPLPVDHVVATPAGARRLIGALEQLISARSARDIADVVPSPRGAVNERHEVPDPPTLPSVVVLVDGDALAERSRLVRVAETGPDVNVHVVWIARSVTAIPAACRTFVDVSGGVVGPVGRVRHGDELLDVALETVSRDEAAATARRLACIEDVSAVVDEDVDIPSRVSYLDLHGMDVLDPVQTAQRWRAVDMPPGGSARPFSLRALVGHAGSEPFYLDLASQGPHALVGGTTGAGKSEFLQSWVLGLAAAHSPERVTFLFVDYKGGSAFADCVRLPHTVGLVTDLTPHLVERALTSLRAELRFRERLLGAHGVKDLESLVTAAPALAPPSLVIVIDEFAALAKEVPEFVDGVVDVAQRGRSLGLHLIMATQRPAGVIKDNLRANTNLRIALRMADEADSSDILGAPLAAHVDPALPGRGLARTGPGRLSTFQAAYAGAHSAPGETRASVRVRELALGAGVMWVDAGADHPSMGEGPSDVTRVVEALSEAARLAALPPPRRPWLDALAESYDLDELVRKSGGRAAFGVEDDPERQAQHVCTYSPDADGNILVVGGAGAGKSTALRSLAVGAVLAESLGPVEVYGLDAARGGLDMLRPLPQVGDVVSLDDSERVGRLMSRLVLLVRERAERFTQARASSIAEYRTLTGDRDLARVLLVVDGYGAFQAGYMNEVGRHHVFTAFHEVITSGRAVGVQVMMSADRVGALHSGIQSLVSRTLVLRLADENQYGMVGLRRSILTARAPAGRGVDLSTRREIHIAVCGGDPRADQQALAIERLAKSQALTCLAPPTPIPRMPVLVAPRDVPATVRGAPVLGLERESLLPYGFDTTRPILIAGQSGTGRTNALAWLATAIGAAMPSCRLVHVSQRRSPLAELSQWSGSFVGPRAAEDALAAVGGRLMEPAEHGREIVLCIENVQDFGGTYGDAPFLQAIKEARRNGHGLVGEADTQGWMSGQLAAEIKSARRGLLLAPEGADAQVLFGIAVPRYPRAEMPAGRGVWVESGRSVVVQIPWVGPELSTDSDHT